MEKSTQKKTRMCSSSSPISFPTDLIFSIFSKLPPKSLLRFRSISKSCSDIITSRTFALIHQPFLPPKSGLLITCPSKLRTAQSFYVADLNGGAACHRLTVPPRFARYTTQSVNGIVCIDFGITATICNPTTSKSLALPYICPKNSPAASSTYFCVNFFGFDPVNNEYKVLSSWGNYLNETIEYRTLTLGTNQWRILDSGGPPLYAQRESLCFAGMIFFRGRMQGDAYGGIGIARLVCFQLNTESFRVINLPNRAPSDTKTSCLVQLKGELGIVDYRIVEDDYCIWILKDYDKETWERRWVNKPLPMKGLFGHEFVVVGSAETGEIMVVWPCLSARFCVTYVDTSHATEWNYRSVVITDLPEYDSFDLSSNSLYVTNYVENILPLH